MARGITDLFPVGPDRRNPVHIELAYSGSNLEYVGWSTPGTATSAAAWRIMRLVYTGSDVIRVEWADGDGEFDNVWDDRASLSYS
jgi:hypothetical protein